MKKLFAILLFICFISCRNETSITLLETINFKVIDTTRVSINGFGTLLGYDIIIKIDSTYYSASMSRNGTISTIYRKLKIKK
jgi:hypothetical protein